jgi:adenosylhomocysteine nucleosidase
MDDQRAVDRIQANDWEGLRQLLESKPRYSESSDPAGVSLLMHCLYRGRRDLAELIAAKKSELDIFEATALGRFDRLKQFLTDRPALNSRSKDGFTALHFAGFFGQPEAARLLLEAGAAADAVAANPMQVMPLHSAASARNLEAVRLLLEHGAPVNAPQHGGWAPIHAAAQNGDLPMIELLVKHGADPHLANDEGKTAATVAREKGHAAIADRLAG